MMLSAKEGVVFEREGTKGSRYSQPASQPAAMDTGEHTASNDLRVEWER